MIFPAGASYLRYKPAAWLEVAGEDAAAFLQGQFSNDLAGAPEGAAVYGLWLDRKGRVQADSFVLRRGPAHWVGSYFSPGAGIRRRLEDFVVADDVAVGDRTADWSGVALVGDGVGAWLASEAREGFAFPGRRAAGENWEWIFPASSERAVRALLPADREDSAERAEGRRISAGIPAVPADIGPGDLPQEGGLEEAAISATKGCYLGQEVMARLRAKGRLRRGLRRVASAARPPTAPAKLWQEGREVGELRSAAPDGAGGFVGLAMLSLAALDPAAPLAAGGVGGPELRLA